MSSRVWHNFLSSSIVYVVPLSLEAFIASSCSSISSYIFKKAGLFKVANFTRLKSTLVICVEIFACWTRSGICVISFCMWNVLLYFVIYFLHVERSLVFCCIFLRVELTLVICGKLFCMWNMLWYFVLHFFIFEIVWYWFSLVWNALWYFLLYIYLCFLFILCWIIPNLISYNIGFPACLKLYLIYALGYCGILCYIFACGTRSCLWNLVLYFLHVERTLVLRNVVLYYSKCGTYSCIVNFVLYLSAFGTRSHIVEYCVIFICAWNVLLYFEILRRISLRVEPALVLWNFLLYLFSCGTRSGIVEFCVIFFFILRF